MIAKRQRSTIPQRISGNTNHTRRQPARLDIRMANCFIAGPSFVRCRIRERCAYYSASSCKSQPFPAASRRKGVDLIKPSHLACKKGGSPLPSPRGPRRPRAQVGERTDVSRIAADPDAHVGGQGEVKVPRPGVRFQKRNEVRFSHKITSGTVCPAEAEGCAVKCPSAGGWRDISQSGCQAIFAS